VQIAREKHTSLFYPSSVRKERKSFITLSSVQNREQEQHKDQAYLVIQTVSATKLFFVINAAQK